jgi:hypothetical protein
VSSEKLRLIAILRIKAELGPAAFGIRLHFAAVLLRWRLEGS